MQHESMFICAVTGIQVVNSVMVIHQWQWKWWTKMERSCLESWAWTLAMWVTLL